MTDEKAIEILKAYRNQLSDSVSNHLDKDIEAFDMAIKALEQTMWIPVSERMPEIHNYTQEYIVTIKGNFIRTAFFTKTNGKSWWSIDNVTAWMPLPQPYKAETEQVGNPDRLENEG